MMNEILGVSSETKPSISGPDFPELTVVPIHFYIFVFYCLIKYFFSSTLHLVYQGKNFFFRGTKWLQRTADD